MYQHSDRVTIEASLLKCKRNFLISARGDMTLPYICSREQEAFIFSRQHEASPHLLKMA